jgi:deferrochelatase/peroxidase EfeB
VGHDVDLADVQGNILRGYRKKYVRHLVLSIHDAASARLWLKNASSGDGALAPQVTTAAPWDEKPSTCLNVGLSHRGLRVLGVDAVSLASFPHEFVDGMASRALKLGDVGPSDPSQWKSEWRDPRGVHLVVTVHADDVAQLDDVTERITGPKNSRAFVELARLDGVGFDEGYVHFGYRDNIAEPHFEFIRDPQDRPDCQPLVEVGAVLLGYANPVEDVRWEVPEPRVLGFNGSFNAFRVLEQRVVEFEEFLSEAADTIMSDPLGEELLPLGTENPWQPPVSRREALREMVAAKILGRWRSGVPLELSPLSPTPDPPIDYGRFNAFGFADDPNGLRCPMASHVRRCNPRDGRIVQRNTNHARRLVRRGIPYGPPFNPEAPDDVERGLLGVFLCGSLIAQYEAVQYDWVNLGLQDPRITGTNDPVIGNNDAQFSSFTLPVGDSSIQLRGFPRFVHTRGGEYLFLPSLSALRYLGALGH